jgi:hypothetical protein
VRAFSCALILQEFAVEANLATDPLLAYVHNNASWYLSGTPCVVLGCLKRLPWAYPEFGQGLWSQDLQRLRRNGLAWNYTGLGFGIDANAQANQNTNVGEFLERTLDRCLAAKRQEVGGAKYEIGSSANGASDAVSDVHGWKYRSCT